MRNRRYLTVNLEISELLKNFELNNSPLYHYTNNKSYESIITNQELILRRCDCSCDKTEVRIGYLTLMKSASELLIDEVRIEFEKIIEKAFGKLKQSYLCCFTSLESDEKITKEHGEFKLKFPEDSPEWMRFFGFLINNTSEDINPMSSKLFFYDIEGFVIYDIEKQKLIANQICLTYLKYYEKGLNIVDINLFLDVIFQFIILTKENAKAWEKEYRICLVSSSKSSFDYEITDESIGKYIKLKFPGDIFSEVG